MLKCLSALPKAKGVKGIKVNLPLPTLSTPVHVPTSQFLDPTHPVLAPYRSTPSKPPIARRKKYISAATPEPAVSPSSLKDSPIPKKQHFPRYQTPDIGVQVMPLALREFNRPWGFDRPEPWDERVRRSFDASESSTKSKQPLLPPKSLITDPSKLPLSLHLILTIKSTHKSAVVRTRIKRRVVSAMYLVVCRGARRGHDGKLVLDDMDGEHAAGIVLTDWTYIIHPTLALFRMPLPDLVQLLRDAMVKVKTEVAKVERGWWQAELAQRRNSDLQREALEKKRKAEAKKKEELLEAQERKLTPAQRAIKEILDRPIFDDAVDEPLEDGKRLHWQERDHEAQDPILPRITQLLSASSGYRPPRIASLMMNAGPLGVKQLKPTTLNQSLKLKDQEAGRTRVMQPILRVQELGLGVLSLDGDHKPPDVDVGVYVGSSPRTQPEPAQKMKQILKMEREKLREVKKREQERRWNERARLIQPKAQQPAQQLVQQLAQLIDETGRTQTKDKQIPKAELFKTKPLTLPAKPKS